MKTLEVGDKVPNFSAVDQDGNKVNLSDFLGKKLAVFFYPAASTPTCTVEACNLRDHYAELQAAGFEIIGVSKDTQKKQKNFKDKYKFPYPLLADTNKEVLNIFGVWGPKKFMGRTFDGIHRITFVLSENGVITKVIGDVKSKNHAAQILNS